MNAKPSRRRNHALWIGPLVVFAGAVSYFTLFARFPTLRDVPWLNLPLVAVGLIVSGLGAARALATGRRWWRVVGVAALGLSALIAAAFVAYVFHLSYLLPPASTTTLALEQAPEFALPDQRGTPVRLSELRGRRVIITFYRGHW